MTTLNEAIAAKNALLQNPDVLAATHITYAYTIGTLPDSVQSVFFDDNEVGAGKILMGILQDKDIKNTFICVSRHQH